MLFGVNMFLLILNIGQLHLMVYNTVYLVKYDVWVIMQATPCSVNFDLRWYFKTFGIILC
jgi:hypothetical protein